jgi:PPM family protein phosphatase
MGEINNILGYFIYGKGDRGFSKKRSYEDRHFVGQVTTAGGLDVVMAVIADGVGGGNSGEVAAELTIEKFVNVIKVSKNSAEQIPQMLGQAIGSANRAVYDQSRKDAALQGMSSTIAVALIHNGKLYVANVGDSRVYLKRQNELRQLTIDHTFANEKIKMGVLSEERAVNHPNADAITRSIGFDQQVVVDLGLYFEGDEDGKQAYLKQGVVLEKDDVVLVCSDGLIKPRHTDPSTPYLSEKEILETIGQYHVEDCSQVLIDLAKGRQVDDNVTVVLIENSKRKLKPFGRRRVIGLSAIGILLLFLIISGVRACGLREELFTIAQAQTAEASETHYYQTAEAAYTPTPTATTRPPLESGEIAGFIDEFGNRKVVTVNQKVLAGGFSQLHVNHTGEFENGLIYMQPGAAVLFEYAPFEEMQFMLYDDSSIFLYPGRYVNGAIARINGAQGLLDFKVSGLCMSLDYTQNTVVATCYEGQCSFTVNLEGHYVIPAGSQFVVSTQNFLILSEIHDIADHAKKWLSHIPMNTRSYDCLQKWVPTPTPIPPTKTLVRISPTQERVTDVPVVPKRTSTPSPTATSTPTLTPTRTFTLAPTNTFTVTATNTTAPSSTNTFTPPPTNTTAPSATNTFTPSPTDTPGTPDEDD